MRIAIIGEGKTEYSCLPSIAGRMGNVVVGRMIIGTNGEEYEWTLLITKKVVPRILAMAEKKPDKILVAIDREGRAECPPELAVLAQEIIDRECSHCLGECPVSVIVSNRRFENTLFADYDAVDALPILQNPASHLFPSETDEHNVLNWIKDHAQPGVTYDDDRHGLFLARNMRLDNHDVLRRSRALQKLIKELQTE